VAIEKRFVDADVLIGANAFALYIELHNTIYQQKRVAVRQVFANFVDFHHFEGKPVVKIRSARQLRCTPLQIKEAIYRQCTLDMKKVSAI
jgi:Holliday junction resolvase